MATAIPFCARRLLLQHRALVLTVSREHFGVRAAAPVLAPGCPFLGNMLLGVPLDQHWGVLPPLKLQDLQKHTGKSESVERVSGVLHLYFP